MPKDPETWMWERARSMLDEAERLERRLFRPGRPGRRPSWTPPVDVFETPTEVWILVALPGVDPGRIEITLEGPILIVAGERTLPSAFRHASVHRLEIPSGRFERRLELPPGTYELAQREMVHGCLALSLKKIG
ncbi:MAG: Hsp20/alpha crystallin family protein [Planctomycetota bacterium]|nr:Hsp20/alpha crystallin family protein [Planctomycetota bacterium]